MPKKTRPTVRDVAALAGVSVATVSYVVNGRDDRIGADTRERVLAAVRDLGYVPNSSARGLRKRRTERVCLVIGSLGSPVQEQLVRDLHVAADADGYGVLTLIVDSPAHAAHATRLLRQGLADGAVFFDAARHFADVGELARGRLAMVVVDNSVTPDGFDVVRTPEYEACGEALDHLLAAGRRRVAFLGHRHDLELGDRSARLRAYRDALRRHGLRPDGRLVGAGADSRVEGYRATAALMALPEPPDALFVASDRAAISAIWAVRDTGRTVPADVAVLGVGNLEEGSVIRPALSTVGQRQIDFSRVAGLLFERLAAAEPPAAREIVLPWSFISREST